MFLLTVLLLISFILIQSANTFTVRSLEHNFNISRQNSIIHNLTRYHSMLLRRISENPIVERVLGRFEDANLKFPELVKKYGYSVEEYNVQTEDGYILKLFRIPRGRLESNNLHSKRPAIFLMHGIIDSSDDWIITGPEKALGYILADAGYDVWFGNARGNTHSRRHITKDPQDIEFWNFSWDEIGRLDLPAMIDFALAKTGEEKLVYIGHSQGTTSYFVMCSLRPEYNSKIKVMFALAPIAWMNHLVSPLIKLFAPLNILLGSILDVIGVGEFLPNKQILSLAGGFLCKDRAITQDICSNILFMISGFDMNQMNATLLPVILGHSPSGSSVRQFIHYGQLYVSGKFCRYDYGWYRNLKEYGTLVPPNYNLHKVTSPVHLIYSSNDWLSSIEDVKKLSQNLGNTVQAYRVPLDDFNHMDYMWAIDVDNLVYDNILKTIKNY